MSRPWICMTRIRIRIRIHIYLVPWIQIRIWENSWIRIRIATNADPKRWQHNYDIHDKTKFNARSLLPTSCRLSSLPRHQVKPKFNGMQVRILKLSIASHALSWILTLASNRCDVRFTWYGTVNNQPSTLIYLAAQKATLAFLRDWVTRWILSNHKRNYSFGVIFLIILEKAVLLLQFS